MNTPQPPVKTYVPLGYERVNFHIDQVEFFYQTPTGSIKEFSTSKSRLPGIVSAGTLLDYLNRPSVDDISQFLVFDNQLSLDIFCNDRLNHDNYLKNLVRRSARLDWEPHIVILSDLAHRVLGYSKIHAKSSVQEMAQIVLGGSTGSIGSDLTELLAAVSGWHDSNVGRESIFASNIYANQLIKNLYHTRWLTKAITAGKYPSPANHARSFRSAERVNALWNAVRMLSGVETDTFANNGDLTTVEANGANRPELKVLNHPKKLPLNTSLLAIDATARQRGEIDNLSALTLTAVVPDTTNKEVLVYWGVDRSKTRTRKGQLVIPNFRHLNTTGDGPWFVMQTPYIGFPRRTSSGDDVVTSKPIVVSPALRIHLEAFKLR